MGYGSVRAPNYAGAAKKIMKARASLPMSKRVPPKQVHVPGSGARPKTTPTY